MRLYLHESGPADAPTILFLHGAGLSGRMWQPQGERLPEFHRLAPDLPEHGRSASVAPFDLGATIAYLGDLVREKAAGGRAHVVGLSFGGVVAQALMVRAPAVVGHVILSGTSMRLGRWLMALNGLNTPILRLLRPTQLARLMAMQFGIPAEYLPLLREDMERFTPDAFARLNQLYGVIETPQDTASPTLVVVGGKETFTAKGMARRLVQTISNARGVVVPGVGHAWSLQAPELFAEMVRAWVTDRPLPSDLTSLD